MKSPFPGMDPHLESRWSDVHVKLIAYIGESLQPLLPRALRARSEQRVLLEADDGEPLRRMTPDVAVVDRGVSGSRGVGAAVATVEPVIVDLSDEPLIDRSVHIIDTSNGNRVVTAIEVLSPWNKASGRLNREYLRKLNDYRAAQVSIVEIDLLRSTRTFLKVDDLTLPADRRSEYLVCVSKGWNPDRWYAYPIPLRQPLPSIPIPLRRDDPEISLALQPLIDRVYVAGGHDDIDYSRPLVPPLSDDDAKWAATLVGAGS